MQTADYRLLKYVCGGGKAYWLGHWFSNPMFKFSSLLLDGFAFGVTKFNSSRLCK